MNDWAIAYFEALAQGSTVEAACGFADGSILDNAKYQNGFITTTVGNSHIAGLKTQTLSYSVMMGTI